MSFSLLCTTSAAHIAEIENGVARRELADVEEAVGITLDL
jgi:hypothetical protein